MSKNSDKTLFSSFFFVLQHYILIFHLLVVLTHIIIRINRRTIYNRSSEAKPPLNHLGLDFVYIYIYTIVTMEIAM